MGSLLFEKIKVLITLSAFTIFLTPNLCFSQQYYSFWHNTSNLLLQNSVKDVTKDKYGFIWIATERELLRYDGYRFTRYDSKLKSLHFKTFRGSIDKDSIIISNEAEKEILLINKRITKRVAKTYDNSDKKLINGKLYNIYFKRNLSDQFVDENYAIEVKDGWYAFSGNRMLYVDKKTGKEIIIPIKFSYRQIKNIFVDHNTLFYTDISKKKVFKITDGHISNIPADSLFTDPDTKIYWEQINNQTFIIHKDIIYISIYKDVLSLQKIVKYPDFSYSQFYSMYFDPSFQVLFLGSLTKGLNIIKPGNFMISKLNTPFANNVFNSALPIGKDRVITPKGMVFSNLGLEKKYTFHEFNNSYTIAEDTSGNILCTRGGKIIKYYKQSAFQKKRDITVPFDASRIIKLNGNFFVSGLKSNFFYLAKYRDDTFNSYAYINRFTAPVVSIVKYDSLNMLVATTNSLYRMNTHNGMLQKIQIPDIALKKICISNGSNFWVISENNGFFLLRGNKLESVPLDQYHYLLSSHDILEDKKGFLWIPTNNGLFRINEHKLIQKGSIKDVSSSYYRYTIKDGLENNEFNGGSCPVGNILVNGMFVLPSMDGLVFFDPEKIKSFYPQKNSFFMDRVRVDTENIIYKDKVILPNSFQKAEFYIDIPYYASNENLVLEAYLNFDNNKQWQRLNNSRIYTLSNMKPGSYELTIRMLLDDHGNYLFKTINIYIPSMYYQTWWFWTLLLSLGIGLLIMLIQNRTKRLQLIVQKQNHKIESVEKNLEITETKLQNESSYQEELFQTITHDIAAPIKHLSILSKMMHQTEDIDLQKKYLENVYQSSEQLYILTMSLREYREIFSNDDILQEPYFLSEIIYYKISLFKDIAAYYNTEIITYIPDSLTLTVSKIALSIIIHNVLDNSIKNTSSGTVTINARQNNNSTIITIADTGTGMGEKRLAYYNKLYEQSGEPGRSGYPGLGLYMIIRLCRKFNIQLAFSNHLPQGTLISLHLEGDNQSSSKVQKTD